MLELCQRSLSDYLETKRKKFPRFYFISAPDLVDVLSKGKHGGFIDRQKRVVNQRGYFIDKDGNVIDYNGNLVFDKVVLGSDGEMRTQHLPGPRLWFHREGASW